VGRRARLPVLARRSVIHRETAATGRKPGDVPRRLEQHEPSNNHRELFHMNTQIRDLSTGHLLTGGALVTAGVLLMRQSAGLVHAVDLAHGWPLFVIMLAFVQLAATLREPRQQGWGLLLAGDWLLANSMTDWAYVQFSVPVLLAGLGLMTIIRGLRKHS
jgi:hypothetical protein